MITPTIGRRVWYWPTAYDLGLGDIQTGLSVMTASDRALPCDAGICYVWGDRMVNLTVADHNGAMHSRCSVALIQEGDAIPEQGGYASWMPYQVGQAKGVEAGKFDKAEAPVASIKPAPAEGTAPAEASLSTETVVETGSVQADGSPSSTEAG